MKNENILKALDCLSGAAFAKAVWNIDWVELSKTEKNSYNQMIFHRRKTGAFKLHEINSIKSYLQSKITDFDVVLNCR